LRGYFPYLAGPEVQIGAVPGLADVNKFHPVFGCQGRYSSLSERYSCNPLTTDKPCLMAVRTISRISGKYTTHRGNSDDQIMRVGDRLYGRFQRTEHGYIPVLSVEQFSGIAAGIFRSINHGCYREALGAAHQSMRSFGVIDMKKSVRENDRLVVHYCFLLIKTPGSSPVDFLFS
jgi:hypothetical protein